MLIVIKQLQKKFFFLILKWTFQVLINDTNIDLIKVGYIYNMSK